MALTGQQMVDEVLDNIARAQTAQTQSGATLADRALRWLNRAQRELARRHDMLYKESTASTVTNQKAYAFPSNVRSLYSLRLENASQSIKLTPTDYRRLDTLFAKPNEYSSRQPEWYIPYKTTNTFELFPIPDTSYTIRLRHSIWPTDLTISTSTDYSANNIDIDDVLIGLATSYGFFWQQEYLDAATWKDEAMKTLKDVWIAEQESFPDWAPRSEGFNSWTNYSTGEYYNDPFVMESP